MIITILKRERSATQNRWNPKQKYHKIEDKLLAKIELKCIIKYFLWQSLMLFYIMIPRCHTYKLNISYTKYVTKIFMLIAFRAILKKYDIILIIFYLILLILKLIFSKKLWPLEDLSFLFECPKWKLCEILTA